MQFDDLRKLATGNVLFNLRRILSPRLVTILYFLGLAGILVWAIRHFFSSFRFGFGNGLWGLLEIAVFGLLALVILRIVCEGVIVFFREHATEAEEAAPQRVHASLIDEVREAIEDLADQEPDHPAPEAPSPVAPSRAVDPRPAPEPVAEEPAVMPDPDAPKPVGSENNPKPEA